MATRRMTAYWGVLAAAALTTLVTAAVAAAIAVFMGQVLPLAVTHDLVTTPGTAMSVTAQVGGTSQAVQGSAALRSRIAGAMPGIPFGFQEAFWSDPLTPIPGALPAPPQDAGQGSTALLQAASMSGVTGQATLVAGQWPGAPGGDRTGAIPAALPASAAALLHVRVGDVLRLRDRITNAPASFDITGIFVRRQESGPADSYWNLSYIPAGGVSASGGSVTYGPLLVSQSAFGPALTMLSGSWVAQPDMAAFSDGNLNAVKVRFDEEAQWLVLERGHIRVACNLGKAAVNVELGSGVKLLLASDDSIALNGGMVKLGPDSVAVLSVPVPAKTFTGGSTVQVGRKG